MNQILYTGSKQKGPASLKSILKFFGVSLALFGIIFLSKGLIGLYQNNELSKKKEDTTVPQIIFEQEGNNAIVTVSYDKGISKVKYNWEGQNEIIKQGNSKTDIILDSISIPSGTNTLYVTAVDVNGKTITESNTYAYDGIAIEFAVINNTYLKMTASDVKGLSLIKYKWNSEEEKISYTNENNATVIEEQTEIPSGKNTFTIMAVNSENKTLTKSFEIDGNHPPKIELFLQGNDLIVKVSDEEGISKIIQQINVDDQKIIDVNGQKEYEYRVNIDNLENLLVKITAIDVKGVGRTYNGR